LEKKMRELNTVEMSDVSGGWGCWGWKKKSHCAPKKVSKCEPVKKSCKPRNECKPRPECEPVPPVTPPAPPFNP
jgi:hypothetical protein